MLNLTFKTISNSKIIFINYLGSFKVKASRDVCDVQKLAQNQLVDVPMLCEGFRVSYEV